LRTWKSPSAHSRTQPGWAGELPKSWLKGFSGLSAPSGGFVGVSIKDLQAAHKLLAAAVKLWRAGDKDAVLASLNRHLPHEVKQVVVADQQTGEVSLQLQPESLYGVMWIQFALAVAGTKQFRACTGCGEWFEVAPGVNRKNRVFCSTACRNKAFRKKIKTAGEMFDAGTSVASIVEQLESDIDTVLGWLDVIPPAKDGNQWSASIRGRTVWGTTKAETQAALDKLAEDPKSVPPDFTGAVSRRRQAR
jgi:hypothetical protein